MHLHVRCEYCIVFLVHAFQIIIADVFPAGRSLVTHSLSRSHVKVYEGRHIEILLTASLCK
jgi:hypothetical protein